MYEPSRHVSTFHIAGFQHYDGALAFDRLKVGAVLDMLPEHDNPYDPNAVELRFEGTKLGYVPGGENDLVAMMAFYGYADAFGRASSRLTPRRRPGTRCVWESTLSTSVRPLLAKGHSEGLIVEEEREEHMTPEQMQRYINMAMREGKSYEQALAGLAWILGLHPVGVEWDEPGKMC